MSQATDLQAIRNGITSAKIPEDVRKTALWHLDKLPNLYQELEKTCESRFLDEILYQVRCLFKAIPLPSSVETMTAKFQAMHERHGIPALGLKAPAPIAVKKPRSKKIVASSRVAEKV